MNADKQVEEMRLAISEKQSCGVLEIPPETKGCSNEELAKHLIVIKGYCKASEIAELKKKYTEVKDINGTAKENELNREQVINELGDYLSRFGGSLSVYYTLSHALTILESDEREIKNLKEECELREIKLLQQIDRARELSEVNKKLSAEKETLKKMCDRILVTSQMVAVRFPEGLDAVNRHCDSEVKNARADTVREMQERFKEKVGKFLISPAFQYQANNFIDQVAKEIVDGKDN